MCKILVFQGKQIIVLKNLYVRILVYYLGKHITQYIFY